MSAGGLLAAQQPLGPDTSSVAGTVYDSLSRAPLSGAVVQLVSREHPTLTYAARTDSVGDFRIPGVQQGDYLIGFLHPAMDSLGLSPSQLPLTVLADRPQRTTLAISSARTIRAAICHSAPRDSSALLVGTVRDADSDAPIPGATLRAFWPEVVAGPGVLHTDQRETPAKANAAGWFALCGIPYDARVLVRAQSPGHGSGYVELVFPPGGVLQRDFAVASDSAAIAVADTAAPHDDEIVRRGSAQLSGIVFSADHRPAPGVQVSVWGTTASTITGDYGQFSFSGLPAGTRMLEARAVGFEPSRNAVNLASHRIVSVNVVLGDKVPVLEAVTIYGRRNDLPSQLLGYFERSRSGVGTFISMEDIAKRKPYWITDVLRGIPGLRVGLSTGAGVGVSMSSTVGFSHHSMRCTPVVYLNGLEFSGGSEVFQMSFGGPGGPNFAAMPEEVFGIEVYTRRWDVPLRYRDLHAKCGAIFIWTKPRLKRPPKGKS
jgi:hypothetical protein